MPSVQLGAGERELAHLRTHVKRILGPLLLGLIVLALAFAAHVAVAPIASIDVRPWAQLAIWIVAALISVPLVVAPWLRWLTTTYTLTDRRVVTRSGLLTRRGHDLPLRSVSDISTERGLTDRLFGCGTIILETSADQPLRLDDIPQVERVAVLISELVAGGGQGPAAGPARTGLPYLEYGQAQESGRFQEYR